MGDHSTVMPGDTPSNIPLYLDTYELAALAGVTHRTVQSWRLKARSQSNKGPAYTQFGARNAPVMYLADDVRTWLIETGQGHLVAKLQALLAKKQEA